MKKTKIPYHHFPGFVLRTPLMPFSFLKELTETDIVSDQQFKEAFKVPLVKEALFLASPSLYFETLKWVGEKLEDEKKIKKLRLSLLKYLTRMASRCTPFGLFAGCRLGSISENTKIELDQAKKNSRHTRLDMNYLVALAKDLVNVPKIRKQLLFYPNSSIYESGMHLRYVEYTYTEQSRRQHHVVAVSNSAYLQKVLARATRGARLEDLAKCLVEGDIGIEEARDFIIELVNSQLLISELEPSVSGDEFLDQMLLVLKKLEQVDHIVEVLEDARTKLKKLDINLGNEIGLYLDLSEKLKQLETGFELKFLFQTDMGVAVKHSTLSYALVEEVKKAMELLNKLQPAKGESHLSEFRKAFFERYETREIPLANALDVEMGLGYLQNNQNGDVNPLVDDLVLPENKKIESQTVTVSPFDKILTDRLFEVIKKGETSLVLKQNELEMPEANWTDLPDTISFMAEIVTLNGEQKIKLSGGGGSSAANLLARFCHGDDDLNQFARSIVQKEKELNSDKILAEIVHLPESRVGNILMRPAFREHEISYLARSVLSSEKQLPLQELTLQTDNPGYIRLKSIKNQKEIVPRLTNAHNYTFNALPVYQFLCDLQTQNKRASVGFSFGPLASQLEFLPRVVYGNIILHEACWNLKEKSLKILQSLFDDDQGLKQEITRFRKELNLPAWVLLAEGDNHLLVNFNNLTSVRMLLDSVRNKPTIRLLEFLFDENGTVQGEKGYHTNQVILSFYNAHKNYEGKKDLNE